MKKIVPVFIFICLISKIILAQDIIVKEFQLTASKPIKSAEKDGWSREGLFAFNANQGTLSNWAAGGEQSTLGANALLNYRIHYRRGKNTWDNAFDIAMGFQNATSFGRFRKTDDRVDITTKYGRELSKSWYVAFLINFNTQILAGYDYADTSTPKISGFLTPGKLLFSPGFDFKPDKSFSLFFSPITVRWVFKSDQQFYVLSKFGVDSFKKVNTELGAYLTAKYNRPIAKWANYSGRLDLFSNYKHNPQNVDVLFTNLVTLKFNKWLATNISLDILYDDDVIKKTQVKEILGLGITIKLK
jgi:hypothetical protein